MNNKYLNDFINDFNERIHELININYYLIDSNERKKIHNEAYKILHYLHRVHYVSFEEIYYTTTKLNTFVAYDKPYK